MKAKKLLIIEDDPTLLRGLKDNFLAQGYQVSTANDGQKGLAAILQDPPDVVLLDLMLPRIDGYEICRAARSRRLHIPIIMLTARSQEQDMVRGLQMGADDYITKPFSIGELISRTDALCRLETAHTALVDRQNDPARLERTKVSLEPAEMTTDGANPN